MDDFIIPVLILAVVLAIAWFAYRALTSSTSDNTPGTEDSRPLGDTAEAHDEINVHDMPLDNPGRHAAEEMAGHEDATTRGMSEGGGAGDNDRFNAPSGDASEVDPAESRGGARTDN